MVDGALYTPDYPLGHLIAFQAEQHFRTKKNLGEEFERICRLGSITPDAWMRQAVGGPLSPDALLQATARALERPGTADSRPPAGSEAAQKRYPADR